MAVTSREPVPPTLGSNQIAWLRKNIPSFDLAWRSTQKAAAEAKRTYEQMGVEPGKVATQQESAQP